ncbi:G-protein coupled receptor Mth2-like [Copidosoma floridanum]|uniref:G-protein coupled receptor Mth2-like n=1 Tax=Copidosoma floridanum TaxID=29053 RepID=UPI000C6F7416|nr:G-protein coupled receptor Mth2-like [Copidosoma floridanum]
MTTVGAMEQCLVLVCLLLATVSASPPQCCPQGQSYVDDSKNCTDGRGILLNCAGGFYMHGLQPEVGEEPYTFTLDANNATWVQFNGSTGFKIPPDEYCLASRTTGGREVMLICFVEETKDPRILIFGTLSLVSSVFLAVTLFVYLALPELREVQDRAMTCMTASFMVAFFFTGIQQLNESTLKEEFTCVFVAFVMYYAYMSAFCWLNVISLNIWRCVW